MNNPSIADKKKENNISEYIIHIYQSEDLLRVYNFQLDEIKKYILDNSPLTEEEKEKELQWYSELASTMEAEDVKEEGRSSVGQKHVEALQALHQELKESDQEYVKIYQDAKADLDKHLELAKGVITDEIQICINGIYGMLLLKLQGKKIHESLMSSLEHYGNILSYLSYQYKQK